MICCFVMPTKSKFDNSSKSMNLKRGKRFKAKRQSDDILAAIINLSYVLGADVDISEARKTLLAHPCYPSLLAVSHVLRELDIENETLKGTITDLSGDDYPALVLMKNQSLMVLEKIDFETRHLYCIDSISGHKTFSFDTFNALWSGVIIRASFTGSPGIAPGKASTIGKTLEKIHLQPISAAISFLVLGIIFSIPAFAFKGYSKSILFLGCVKLAGLILSLFFFRGSSKSTFFFQKICSTRGIFDCKKVIQSPAGKLLGISLIEWSIIYFSSGILLLFMGIHGESIITYEKYIAIMNILALGFSIYLLVYQSVYLKKLCLLCLLLQLCIWAEFFIVKSSVDLSFQWISGYSAILFMLCLLTGFLTWTAIRERIFLSWKVEKNEIDMLKIRRNPGYVDFILSQTKKVDTGSFSREMAYGDDKAIFNILLVLHPLCRHCRETFVRFNKLVRQGQGKVRGIIRILTGSKDMDGLDDKVAGIVFYYLAAHNAQKALDVLSDWFYILEKSGTVGKNKLKWLQTRYPCPDSVAMEEATQIMEVQRKWGIDFPIDSTPTLFFNDRQLPQDFQLSDLTYTIFDKL